MKASMNTLAKVATLGGPNEEKKKRTLIPFSSRGEEVSSENADPFLMVML